MAKYEELSVTELRKLAKERGLSGTSTLRKAELIGHLIAADDENKAAASAKPEKPVRRTRAKAAAKVNDSAENAAAKAGDSAEKAPAKAETAVDNVPAKAEDAADKAPAADRPATAERPALNRPTENSASAPSAETPVRRESARAPQDDNRRPVSGDMARPRMNRNVRTVRNGRDQNDRYAAGDRYRRNDNRMSGGYDNRSYDNRTSDNRGYDNRTNDTRSYDNRTSDNRGYDTRTSDTRGYDNRTNDTRSYDNRTNDNRTNDTRGYDSRTTDTRTSDTRGYDNRTGDTRSYDNRPQEQRLPDFAELDSGVEAYGILEVMPEGFGFIRCDNFLPGDDDVYVAPSQIRRFGLRTGDMVRGKKRVKSATEKFGALLYISDVNGYPVATLARRPKYADLTTIFPNERIRLERPNENNSVALRVMDLLSPIGKGQRGMIVSPPKAGKTTLLKQVAKSVTEQYPEMHLIILLIDERPEEVTDMKESVTGEQVEVIYSTFDEQADNHRRVSEMVIERARRLVEHGRDVMILLDSITRLTRAYNQTVPPSGRTLSGGLDPAALYMPKRFFGAARNFREGGSLTILATALIDTGSRMDDVVYEEFKGTGNMEIVLNRKLSEKRIFPAIDVLASGTRRDDLLLTPGEQEAADIIHRATNSSRPEESVEKILDLFAHTKNNAEFVALTRRRRMF